MTDTDQGIGNTLKSPVSRLAKALSNKRFRHSFMARQLKLFLAEQIRALRGDLTQAQFGVRIGKPQSVVSRLEKQADRQISIQTLIDIAERLDIAVIVRFVDFPTFLRYTEDYSDAALSPASYRQEAINQQANEAPVGPTDEAPAPPVEPPDLLIRDQRSLSDPQDVTTAQAKTGSPPLREINGDKSSADRRQLPLENVRRSWGEHQTGNPLRATG
jgi:transcriptional regulator with XRE-family HTH domain